jgi:putative Holliday junction resolvase
MRWLGLDIGASRVGVAISDDSERVVTGLDPIPYRGPDDLAVRVGELAAERQCAGIVVGVPRTRGGASRGERRVAAVAKALRDRLRLDVALVDETGTTKAAEERLAGAGVPRRRWAALVDGVAAAIILEEMLETRRRARMREGGGVDLDADRC